MEVENKDIIIPCNIPAQMSSEINENITRKENEIKLLGLKDENIDSSINEKPDLTSLVENMEQDQTELEQMQFSAGWNYLHTPTLLTHATAVFTPTTCSNDANERDNSFTKGCKWSPDGTCLLANCSDRRLRLFDTPYDLYTNPRRPLPSEMPSVLEYKTSGTIYDYCWSPTMNSSDPKTCSLICTAKQCPIHMVDAFTGKLKCSYRGFDAMDEPTPAFSICFTADSSKIISGYTSELRIFDVERPGRDCTLRKTHSKKSPGQKGILSCLDSSAIDVNLVAVGSYLRSVALFDLRSKGMAAMFNGQVGGLTQVKFSSDGQRLYSGGRKDNEIICWDLRHFGRVLYTMKRRVSTNQRIYFDLDYSQKAVWSASGDGAPLCFPLPQTPDENDIDQSEVVVDASTTWTASRDCVNGISCHPFLPIVATSSGQRRIVSPNTGPDSSEEMDDATNQSDEDDYYEKREEENAIKLWYCGDVE